MPQTTQAPVVHCFQYVTLTEEERGLRIELTDTGREEIQDERFALGQNYGEVDFFAGLLSDALENGWDLVEPFELGALTDAPILGVNVTRGDDGFIVYGGERIYWHSRYQIESAAERLALDGHVCFDRAEPVE